MRYTIPEVDYYLREQYKEEYAAGKSLVLRDFTYTTGQLALAHGAQITPQITMQANADFLCTGASVRVNEAGATYTASATPVPNVTALLLDTGGQNPWMQQAVDIVQWASGNSSAGFRRDFDWPRWVSGRASVSCGLQSFEAAKDWQIEMQLHGILIFIQ